jgi:hypothetical protein
MASRTAVSPRRDITSSSARSSRKRRVDDSRSFAFNHKASIERAGGGALLNSVYGSEVGDGTTMLTHIHHRQTPLWIMQGRAQAGVT